MTHAKLQLITIISGALVMAGSAGCANTVREIDQAVDCNDLCNRYRDCYDSEYDTASCRDRCHDTVTNDPRAANDCDTCLDGRACSESFACASECYGLIP